MKALFKSTRQRRLSLLVMPLFVFFLFLFPTVSQAEEGMLNFHVTPEFPESQLEGSNSYFDLNLIPGATELLPIKIQNASSKSIKVQITPHTAYTNVHGVVEYGKDAVEPDTSLLYALDELLEPSDVIELDGNEIKTVNVPLHMPEKAFEGFLAGGLRIAEMKEDIEEPETDEEGIAIKNDFAYVIGVVVSNKRDSVKAELDLLDVFADQLNYRNVFSATIQNFTPTFVNRMSVEATVKRVGESDVLYKANAEQLQMAPNSHFDFPIALEGDRFQTGEYVLNLKATSGEEEWVWERNFSVEADEARSLNRQDVTIDSSLNWWMIGSITLIILLLGIIIYLIIWRNKVKVER